MLLRGILESAAATSAAAARPRMVSRTVEVVLVRKRRCRREVDESIGRVGLILSKDLKN